MTDRKIIERLRGVVADLSLGDTEYSEKHRVPLDTVRNVQKYRAATALEIIADDLEDYEEAEEEAEEAEEDGRVYV